MNAIDYDHVAMDHDSTGPACSLCGSAGPEYEIRPCAAKHCESRVCCDCRAKSDIWAELDVCCDTCAIAVIDALRSDVHVLRQRNREMAWMLREIRDMDGSKYQNGHYALGVARSKAIIGAAWAEPERAL